MSVELHFAVTVLADIVRTFAPCERRYDYAQALTAILEACATKQGNPSALLCAFLTERTQGRPPEVRMENDVLVLSSSAISIRIAPAGDRFDIQVINDSAFAKLLPPLVSSGNKTRYNRLADRLRGSVRYGSAVFQAGEEAILAAYTAVSRSTGPERDALLNFLDCASRRL